MKSDTIASFQWSTLYERYDALCGSFDASHELLAGLSRSDLTDRTLYYWLIDNCRTMYLTGDDQSRMQWYRAAMYWKHQSGPSRLNLRRLLLPEGKEQRTRLSEVILESASVLSQPCPRTASDAVCRMQELQKVGPPFAKSVDAIPSQSTLLHLVDPDVVPIYDEMVLRSLGEEKQGSKMGMKQYERVFDACHDLARYCPSAQFPESRIRLIDMALWTLRGSS